MLKRFLKESGGNVALMFSGTVLLIMVGVGFAIDYSAMSSQKTVLQAHADAATLAAASSGLDQLDDLQALAETIVNGNNFDGDTLTTTLTIKEDQTIHVDVSSNYQMSIMGMFGEANQTISAFAESPPKGTAKLNLALVLDTTGSMEGSRITTLRTAAKDLVDTFDLAPVGEVKISMVPFGRYVRIPTSNLGQPWLEVQPPQEFCWDSLDVPASSGCEEDEEDGWECDTPVYVERCETLSWNGCMASRVSPWHKRDDFGGIPMQGFAGGGSCQSELLPLTDNHASVKTAIDALFAEDKTYIPAGLVWGWRTLTETMPFTEANLPDKHLRKNALLLMTDGNNTRSYGGTDDTGFAGVFHWEDNQSDADDVTAELCAGIKNDGITIYTVAFEVTDADTIALLRNCATAPDKFYDADDDIELENAFTDIGLELAQVRISK